MPANLNTSVSSSPYFNLYIMSQIYDKDNAFLSKSITVQQLLEERGDVHHVFPKKYLQSNGFNNRGQYNQIANYAYTEQVINLAIKAKSPKEYMGAIKAQVNGDQMKIGEINNWEDLQENLKMNCIPSSIFELESGDYEVFLEQRRGLIVEKIRKFYSRL